MVKTNQAETELTGARLNRISRLFHYLAARSALCLVTMGIWINPMQAAIQFDVFLGYNGVIREGNYFPVVVEVANDGASFQGIFEISSSSFGSGQVRRYSTELATNTRKRFVIPVFAANRFSSWNARLLDQQGKLRVEAPALGINKVVNQANFVMGALPKSFGGLPTFPETRPKKPEAQPVACHFRPELFPDNALTLEALNAVYLNSQKALDLKMPQVQALLKYVRQGGHLILAVEQTSDVNATPWLKSIVPCTFESVTTLKLQSEILSWVRNRYAPSDSSDGSLFRNVESTQSRASANLNPQMAKKYGLTVSSSPSRNSAENLTSVPLWAALEKDTGFQSDSASVCTGNLTDGQVVLSVDNTPLIINAPRGRGQITVLTFSPERDPIFSWKNRNWFWAAVAQVPAKELAPIGNEMYGGWNIDGVIGAMIDSKQIRKLPIKWLLVLLVVYLAVIGPLDQYILKKINRQMWTWITFPVYVVFFSGLIYVIGYKLRAGETELNELHLVDVFPSGEKADFRGRTYLSIYSPANAKFKLADKLALSTIRGESLGFSSGAQESSKAEVDQLTQGFNAEVFVPVWTSQLFVNDWWQSGPTPISFRADKTANGLKLVVTNHLNRALSQVRVVCQGRLAEVGNLFPKEVKIIDINLVHAKQLSSILQGESMRFQQAVSERQRAFSGREENRQWDMPLSTFCVSLLSSAYGDQMAPSPVNFSMPSGFDLGAYEKQGLIIVTAWDAGNSFIPALSQFSPKRSQKDTLLRLVAPWESNVKN